MSGNQDQRIRNWMACADKASESRLSLEDSVHEDELDVERPGRDAQCVRDPAGYAAYRVAHLPPSVAAEYSNGDRGLAQILYDALGGVLKKCGSDYYYFNEDKAAWVKKDRDAVCQITSKCLNELLVDLIKATNIARRNQESREDVDDAVRKRIESIHRVISYVQRFSGAASITRMASAHFEDSMFEQTLDSCPYLLGVQNGVIDIRTGALRPRCAADNVYSICPVEYDPNASSHAFHEVVLAAMADDEEMARYLQKLLGYGITGEVCEEIFPVFTGTGRNCKGVLTQSLSFLLGSLYREMDVSVITDRPVCNISAERAKLLGARIALFNELRPNEKLKTNEIQLLSGGDGIPAKAMYKDPMTIQPRHLCILSTNHMPELSDVIPGGVA